MAWVACAFSPAAGAGTGCPSRVAQLVASMVPTAASKISLPLIIGILIVLVIIVAVVVFVVVARGGSAPKHARRTTEVRVRPTTQPRHESAVPTTVAPPESVSRDVLDAMESLDSYEAPNASAEPASLDKPTEEVPETTPVPSVTVAPAPTVAPVVPATSAPTVVPAASVAPEASAAKRFLYHASYSDAGGREVNEDAVGIQEFDFHGRESLCIVVADGLGGHGHGEMASQAATRVILKRWDPAAEGDGLAGAFEMAHQAVCDLQSPTADMRTTAVALSLAHGRATWANVGDSRLYHFNNGKLAFQTIDHSVSQMAVVLGQITPDEIRGHEDRSRLVKALGQEGALKPDIGEIALARADEDAFLLCTDGFWEYVLEEEMTKTLQEATSPTDWLARMREIRDGRAPADCDNNSAAVVWLSARDIEEA